MEPNQIITALEGVTFPSDTQVKDIALYIDYVKYSVDYDAWSLNKLFTLSRANIPTIADNHLPKNIVIEFDAKVILTIKKVILKYYFGGSQFADEGLNNLKFILTNGIHEVKITRLKEYKQHLTPDELQHLLDIELYKPIRIKL